MRVGRSDRKNNKRKREEHANKFSYYFRKRREERPGKNIKRNYHACRANVSAYVNVLYAHVCAMKREKCIGRRQRGGSTREREKEGE